MGSALFLTLALMMPLAGYLGDVWSRKWIIAASVIFWSAATAVTGMAQGVLGLIAFRSVATAGGESFYAPAAYPLLAAFHQKTRALAMSVHQAALYVGVMTSGFLGGSIAERWGWRVGFLRFRQCGDSAGIRPDPAAQRRPASRGGSRPLPRTPGLGRPKPWASCFGPRPRCC